MASRPVIGVREFSIDYYKQLHESTRAFAQESPARSWWATATTFLILAITMASVAVVSSWPLRVALSILTGMLLVRTFVLYHDFMHGAILRRSRIGKALFYVYGLLILTPPRSWRYSHNFHHANVGKPISTKAGSISMFTSDVGAVPLMTTEMWRRASFWQRLRYRISRHPITILAAYVTVFMFSITLLPLLENPRKNWDGFVSLVLHGGIIAAVWLLAGFEVVFFVILLPFAIAAATGAYLFFAQHNYEGLRILPIEEWSHFRAAIESSSYLKLGPLMNWFTGNIGYHHVHHLNSLIPFYRLPETMGAIPQLQSPVVTRLRPRDILTCFRLSLWDPQSQRLVPFP